MLTFNGEMVELTPKEASFAGIMVKAMPGLMTYGDVAQRVWARSISDDLVKALVYQTGSALRTKLATVGLDLKTVRGMGFTLGVADK